MKTPRPLRLACGDTVLIKASQLDLRERCSWAGELIGSDSVAAACEIVTVAIETLKAAGLTGISVVHLTWLVDTFGGARQVQPVR
jgi:ATP phosphoribosyltransferase regulatory subunit